MVATLLKLVQAIRNKEPSSVIIGLVLELLQGTARGRTEATPRGSVTSASAVGPESPEEQQVVDLCREEGCDESAARELVNVVKAAEAT